MDLTELFRPVLASALTPLVLSLGKRIAVPRAHLPFLFGYVSLLAAFWLRFAQTTALRSDLTRFSVHLGYALGGLGFAWAAWELRQHVLQAEERAA